MNIILLMYFPFRSRKNSNGSSTCSETTWNELNRDDDGSPYWLPLEEEDGEEPRPFFVKFSFMRGEFSDEVEDGDIKCYVEVS